MTKTQLERIFNGAGYDSLNQIQVDELHTFVMETRQTLAGIDNFITIDSNNLIKVKYFKPKAMNAILPSFSINENEIILERPYVCSPRLPFRKPKIGDKIFLLDTEGSKVNNFEYTITNVSLNKIIVDSIIDRSKISSNRRLSFGSYEGTLLPGSTAFLASYTEKTTNPFDIYIDGNSIVSIIFKSKSFL